MTKKYEILGKYIKDLSSETRDVQTYLFVKEHIGKYQLKINEWCIKKGGHTRTGREDNIRLNKNMLAPSNASLVKLTANICKINKRPIANWKQTRQILGLPLKFN